MIMEIKITPEAHNDIANIYQFIKKDGEQIAKNQVGYIYKGIENLKFFPDMGISLQKFVERTTALRCLIINKVYIIIYEITESVEILRVFRKDQDFISDLGISD